MPVNQPHLRMRHAAPANVPWIGLAAAVVAGLVALLLVMGPSVMIMAPWDVFLLLDGAWRMLVGQTPHTDYFNPIGPLTYFTGTAGMRIAGESLHGLVVGNAIFLVITAGTAMWVAFRRLPPPWAFMFVAFVALLLAATRSLGWDPQTPSYAMLYNRHGWALLSILLVQLFVPDRASGGIASRGGSLLEGALIGALFLCKITFFLVGAGAFALAQLLSLRDRWRQIPWAATGFAMACAAAWLAIGFNPLHYIHDIQSALAAQSHDYRMKLLREALDSNVLNFLTFSVLAGLLAAANWPALAIRRGFWLKAALVCAYMLCSALFITIGNARERADIPMFFVAGLILLVTSRSLPLPAARESCFWKDWRLSLAAVAVILMMGRIAWGDAQSLAHSYGLREYRISEAPQAQRFASERLSDFVIPRDTDWRTTFWLSRDLPPVVNDGLEMLRRHVAADKVLVVLGYGDPFSFALGYRAHKHSPVWWDKGVSYNLDHFPVADTIFEAADYVMIPMLPAGGGGGCCENFVTSQESIYGGYLAAHYAELERTEHWRLLQRKS